MWKEDLITLCDRKKFMWTEITCGDYGLILWRCKIMNLKMKQTAMHEDF